MPKGEQNWFAAGRNCLAVHKRLDPAVLTQAKLLVQHSAQHFKYGIFSGLNLSVQKQSNASAPCIYQCARVSVCVCISVAGAEVSFSWPWASCMLGRLAPSSPLFRGVCLSCLYHAQFEQSCWDFQSCLKNQSQMLPCSDAGGRRKDG